MISEVKNKSIILSNARKIRHYNDSLSVKIVVNAFIIIQWGSGVLNVTEIKMNSNTLNLNHVIEEFLFMLQGGIYPFTLFVSLLQLQNKP